MPEPLLLQRQGAVAIIAIDDAPYQELRIFRVRITAEHLGCRGCGVRMRGSHQHKIRVEPDVSIQSLFGFFE